MKVLAKCERTFRIYNNTDYDKIIMAIKGSLDLINI